MKNEASALQSLPTAWETRPLAKVAAVFTDGNWIESKDQADSGIRLVQTGNVGIGQFKDRSEKARFIDEATFARLKCFEVMPGDLLISRLPDPVGRACIVPDTTQKMITAVDCSIVRVHQTTVDPKFLVYYSQTQEYLRAVDDRCSGTTRRRISRRNLGNVPVPLPPLDEQKRIVAVLDQAFAALDRARAHAQANLADANEINVSIIMHEINAADPTNSTRMTLGDLCVIARGGSPRPIKRFLTDDENGVNWIKISDATASGQYIESTKQKIIREGIYRSRFVEPGAFLLTNSMSFGRPYVLRTSGCIHDGWLVLEPDYKQVHQDYLYYLLGSSKVFREFDRLAAGSTVRNLNIGLVSKVAVTLPSLEDQRRIADTIARQIARVKKLVNAYQLKLADLTNLRQSLLQKAFSGELA